MEENRRWKFDEEEWKDKFNKALDKALETWRLSMTDCSTEQQTTATKKGGVEVEARKVCNDCLRNSALGKEEMIDVVSKLGKLGYAGKVFDGSPERVLEEDTYNFVKIVETRKGDMIGERGNRPGIAPIQWNTPTCIQLEFSPHINSHFNGYDKFGKGTDVGGYGEVGTDFWGSYRDGGSGGGPGHGRVRTLDLPRFDGNDSDGWNRRIEQLLYVYRVSEDELLEAVEMAFVGDVLRWYKWENKRRPFRCWSDLKMVILRQYISSTYQNFNGSYGGYGGYGGRSEFRVGGSHFNEYRNKLGGNKSGYLEDSQRYSWYQEGPVNANRDIYRADGKEVHNTKYRGQLHHGWEYDQRDSKTWQPSCAGSGQFGTEKWEGFTEKNGRDVVKESKESEPRSEYLSLVTEEQSNINAFFSEEIQLVNVVEESLVASVAAKNVSDKCEGKDVGGCAFNERDEDDKETDAVWERLENAMELWIKKRREAVAEPQISGTVIKNSGTVFASRGHSFRELASRKKKGCNELCISGSYTEVSGDVVVKESGVEEESKEAKARSRSLENKISGDGVPKCLEEIFEFRTTNPEESLLKEEMNVGNNEDLQSVAAVTKLWDVDHVEEIRLSVEAEAQQFHSLPGGDILRATITYGLKMKSGSIGGKETKLIFDPGGHGTEVRHWILDKIHSASVNCGPGDTTLFILTGQFFTVDYEPLSGLNTMGGTCVLWHTAVAKSTQPFSEPLQYTNDDQISSLCAKIIGISIPAHIDRDVTNHTAYMLDIIIGQLALEAVLIATGNGITCLDVAKFISTFDPGGCEFDLVRAVRVPCFLCEDETQLWAGIHGSQNMRSDQRNFTILSGEKGEKVPDFSRLNTTPSPHGLLTAREILTVFLLRNITKKERVLSEYIQLAQSFGDASLLVGINRRDDKEIEYNLGPIFKSSGHNLNKDVKFLPGSNLQRDVGEEACKTVRWLLYVFPRRQWRPGILAAVNKPVKEQDKFEDKMVADEVKIGLIYACGRKEIAMLEGSRDHNSDLEDKVVLGGRGNAMHWPKLIWTLKLQETGPGPVQKNRVIYAGNKSQEGLSNELCYVKICYLGES